MGYLRDHLVIRWISDVERALASNPAPINVGPSFKQVITTKLIEGGGRKIFHFYMPRRDKADVRRGSFYVWLDAENVSNPTSARSNAVMFS